jgi:large conductance mechanosensitive channel protein
MAQRKQKTKKPASHTTRIVTTGSVVRIEQPKSRRQEKGDLDLVEIVQEVNPASGFFNFLREQAVVGLAVGFIIGTQAQTVVKQLVSSFINPLFTLFFGQAISDRAFSITFHGRTAVFDWGVFIYGLLNFIFVLLAIYLVIKFFKLDKLDKPKK